LYIPKRFLSKDYVDSVGARIEAARKQRPKKRMPKVLDDVVDTCRESHHAAKGDDDNTAAKRYDSTGLMILVCRHDIPLFLVDIDTPGEQQKYAVSLIEHLLTLVPQRTNLVVLYDIGCVLDRSLEMVCCMSECPEVLQLTI
jgi:hypothetical protein